MGRCIYQISRWKLEKGGAIGLLEQLLGSRTMGSTVLTHFQLQSFNLIGVLLVLCWAFSPFGGQSLLRMLDSRLATVTHSSNIWRDDPETPSMFSSLRDVRDPDPSLDPIIKQAVDEHTNLIDALYNAALLSPDSVKNSSMDIWGNLKIPLLSSYGDAESSDWQQVQDPSKMEYSSLVGIPLHGVPVGNTTFNLETSYIDITCYNVSSFLDPLNADGGLSVGRRLTRPAPSWPYKDAIAHQIPNGTWQGHPALIYPDNAIEKLDTASWELALDRFVNPTWYQGSPRWNFDDPEAYYYAQDRFDRPRLFLNETGIEAGPTKLLFQSFWPEAGKEPPATDIKIVLAECRVFQKYVESRGKCTKESPQRQQNCTIIEQRPSRMNHVTEKISPLSFPRIFDAVSKGLPRATHQKTGYALVDKALVYIKQPSSLTLMQTLPFTIEDVPKEIFGVRLSQIINTYLYLSQTTDIIVGLDPQISEYGFPNISVATHVENLVEVYSISQPWIAGYIISCIVLLSGGVLSVILIHTAKGPEVLGYVSTAVRDSKYIPMPRGSGRMDGLDLTRAIQTRRIRYGLTNLTEDGEPVLGVGREEEIGLIKKRKEASLA